MRPVENGWKNAKSLVVVTNGALGELPLGLLPTANVQVDLQAGRCSPVIAKCPGLRGLTM